MSLSIPSQDLTPLRTAADLDPLIRRLARSRVVMLGEASHGTHEFYEWRRVISRELIEKHGFRFIAVEGDWPPCQALDRFVRGAEGMTAQAALGHFNRWPSWMWANTDVLALIEWMRERNSTLSARDQAGFHGLDVYSLFESIDAVLGQLEKLNPFLARRVRNNYSCFGRYRHDEKSYARSLFTFPEGCESQVVESLQEILKLRLNGFSDREEALFDVRQNARIVANAEHYYRAMVHGNEDSWNVRDRHMMETLDLLLKHYGPDAKAIVWEHNTHIGDYRATPMERMGQINIGGLARLQYGESAVSLVGFGTYEGSVIASHAWDGPVHDLSVPPAREGSYEAIFHQAALEAGEPSFYLSFGPRHRHGFYAETRPHRAIGVVYDPEHERYGNYVPTSLSRRYDAFVFIDRTRALQPIAENIMEEGFPETYPMGQ